MQVQRGTVDNAVGFISPNLVMDASRCQRGHAVRRFAACTLDGVNGLPHGLIEIKAVHEVDGEEDMRHPPHAAVGTVAALKASRACRIAARDRPGGERQDTREDDPEGVAGTVSNVVPPKRHRCLSVQEESSPLSSEVLPLSASVVCSALSRSSTKTWRVAFSF